MILVAFIPGTRSTVAMDILKALGATLARDRYPIALLETEGMREAIAKGIYRVTDQTETDFEVEQFRRETSEYGRGVNTEGKPANLAMKVIAFPGIQQSKLHAEDRVVFLVRKPADVCRSQEDRGFFRQHRLNYRRLVWHFEEWAKSAPCPVYYLDTDALMVAPLQVVEGLAAFCGLSGNRIAAASLVDISKVKPSATEADDDAHDEYRKVKAKCR